MASRIAQVSEHLATPRTLHAEYLCVGLGMSGLAFVDTLLSSSPTTTAILIDRNDRPGTGSSVILLSNYISRRCSMGCARCLW
jgi:hypothetical protein